MDQEQEYDKAAADLDEAIRLDPSSAMASLTVVPCGQSSTSMTRRSPTTTR